MRLFVAIDLDESARAAISAEQKRLRALDAGRAALTWVRGEHLHVTLLFLGEVDESKVPTAASCLAQPIGQRPFDVVFEGLGVFPPRGAPRTLWVGASTGEVEVRTLGRTLTDRFIRAGFLLEDRPLHPHVTLARWKVSRGSDRARVLSAARRGPITRILVDHAVLCSSRLSSSGPTYAEVARANLTA